MKRRGFLASTGGLSAAALVGPGGAAVAAAPSPATSGSIPITGKSVPQLAAFDRTVVGFLERFNIPGGRCAVATDGPLVYAHGFGYVDEPAASGSPVAEVLARPPIPTRQTGLYHGRGWDFRPNVTVMGHAGAFTFGTFSVVFRLPGGITHAALFNDLDLDFDTMGTTIEQTLIGIADSIGSWPAGDLYRSL